MEQLEKIASKGAGADFIAERIAEIAHETKDYSQGRHDFKGFERGLVRHF